MRAAWAAVDGHARVGEFIDMHDVGDALLRAGFAAPVLDVERYTLRYTDVHGLAADLKATGARNGAAGRLTGLTSPRKFAAMQNAYEAHRSEGRLPATCEVVFAQAWAPVETRTHAVIALMLGKGAADLREGDFPLGVRMRHTPAIVGILEKHVLDGAIRCLKLMRARDLNQLTGFGEA